MVLHSLNAAVRKSNMVLAWGCIAITSLILSKVSSGIVIMDGVSIVVVSRLLFVSGGMVGSLGSSKGNSGKEGRAKDEGLEQRREIFGIIPVLVPDLKFLFWSAVLFSQYTLFNMIPLCFTFMICVCCCDTRLRWTDALVLAVLCFYKIWRDDNNNNKICKSVLCVCLSDCKRLHCFNASYSNSKNVLKRYITLLKDWQCIA